MSYVTNLVVIPGRTNQHSLAVKEHLRDLALRPILVANSGGAKVLEADVWTAGLNHADEDDLISDLRTIPWTDPAAWCAWIQTEEWPARLVRQSAEVTLGADKRESHGLDLDERCECGQWLDDNHDDIECVVQ